MTKPFSHARIVGHPGHELRAFPWMELHRPIVCVNTDGSGHPGPDRESAPAAHRLPTIADGLSGWAQGAMG